MFVTPRWWDAPGWWISRRRTSRRRLSNGRKRWILFCFKTLVFQAECRLEEETQVATVTVVLLAHLPGHHLAHLQVETLILLDSGGIKMKVEPGVQMKHL